MTFCIRSNRANTYELYIYINICNAYPIRDTSNRIRIAKTVFVSKNSDANKNEYKFMLELLQSKWLKEEAENARNQINKNTE